MAVPAPKAPFWYFGGKSAIAAEVWSRCSKLDELGAGIEFLWNVEAILRILAK